MDLVQFENLKRTAFLRLFSFWKVPLLWWAHPSVVDFTPRRTVIKIPLTRKTKNHLNSMYFGALCMGAELSIAFKAVETIQRKKLKVDFVFKDFHAEFLKRPQGDVHFICEEGLEVEKLIDKCIDSKQRETQEFTAFAIVPDKSREEKVAKFKLRLSVKIRS
jgi:hypothetical protein